MTSKSTKKGPWTSSEDQALLALVRQLGPQNWVRIAAALQHRSPKQCRERYHQNLKPSLNKQPISEAEGAVIEDLVSRLGKKWAEIARVLNNGRSDNAVKNWWNGGANKRLRARGTVSVPASVSASVSAPASTTAPVPATATMHHPLARTESMPASPSHSVSGSNSVSSSTASSSPSAAAAAAAAAAAVGSATTVSHYNHHHQPSQSPALRPALVSTTSLPPVSYIQQSIYNAGHTASSSISSSTTASSASTPASTPGFQGHRSTGSGPSLFHNLVENRHSQSFSTPSQKWPSHSKSHSELPSLGTAVWGHSRTVSPTAEVFGASFMDRSRSTSRRSSLAFLDSIGSNKRPSPSHRAVQDFPGIQSASISSTSSSIMSPANFSSTPGSAVSAAPAPTSSFLASESTRQLNDADMIRPDFKFGGDFTKHTTTPMPRPLLPQSAVREQQHVPSATAPSNQRNKSQTRVTLGDILNKP
ncbi:LAFA_0E07162g1_1 [Lachancea sp. 'fantastica']|nr:LAFA_0E07162g1_1 [Lachancea sp. 'fantastica']